MKSFSLPAAGSILGVLGTLFLTSQSSHAATYVWTGHDSGKPTNWFSPSNWNHQNGVTGTKAKKKTGVKTSAITDPSGVPGPGDSAVIGAGATVAINKPLEIADLTVEDGGVLQGSGAVSVTDSLTLDGANLQGTGGVTLTTDATVTLSDTDGAGVGSDNVIAKPVDNQGNLVWNSGDVTLSKDFRNHGTFYVGCDAVLNVPPTATNDPTLYNAGTLIKAISIGQTEIEGSFVNTGDIYVRSGLLNVGDNYVQNDGSLNLDGGDVISGGTLNIEGGIVKGIGSLNCDVVNDGGTFKPGHSPGYITIFGNYTQTSNGSLQLEIGGTDPGSTYDQMNIYGSAYLNGNLDLIKWNNYMPSAGQSYDLITCYNMNDDFTTFTGLYPGNSLVYKVTQTPTDYVATVRSDTTAPTLTMSQAASGVAYNSLGSAKGTANDTATGSGVAKITLRLYRYASGSIPAGYWAGGSSWTTGYTASANEFTCNGTTTWSLSLPSLSNGQYYIRVTARDNLGNSSTTGNVVFTKVSSGGTTAAIAAPSDADSASLAMLLDKVKSGKRM